MAVNPTCCAVIDLGSNSFHFMAARDVAGSVQIISRLKHKVRLAAGLDSEGMLSVEAMARGWRCLQLFAEELCNISPQQTRIVATATLRLAKNATQFLTKAEQILGYPIELISGEHEARLIYQGVIQTSSGVDQCLVIDIGGGSTEFISINQRQPLTLFSLSMGCVTWSKRYFPQDKLDEAGFQRAESAARALLQTLRRTLLAQGWQGCVGTSGTIKTMLEIISQQGLGEQITLEKLLRFKQQAIACQSIQTLQINGLTPERAQIFPGGLAILIAIFTELTIDHIILAGGALREGVLYDLLHIPPCTDVRARTVKHIQQRYLLNTELAARVTEVAAMLFNQANGKWVLGDDAYAVLHDACCLYQLGLSIEYHHAPHHAAWLIKRLDMPGFTLSQKRTLAALIVNQSGEIDTAPLNKQYTLRPKEMEQLCRLFRLAIILARPLASKALRPKLLVHEKQLQLALPADWLAQHPLCSTMLEQECLYQQQVQWELQISGQY